MNVYTQNKHMYKLIATEPLFTITGKDGTIIQTTLISSALYYLKRISNAEGVVLFDFKPFADCSVLQFASLKLNGRWVIYVCNHTQSVVSLCAEKLRELYGGPIPEFIYHKS